MTYDKFHYWITHNPNVNSFSTWLLDEKESGFQLTDTRTTPNYHQTIGDMANGNYTHAFGVSVFVYVCCVCICVCLYYCLYVYEFVCVCV